MRLLRFKANIAGKPRIRDLEGRPHYVFPVRVWREGVLNGNDNHGGGATLFRGREIKRALKAWNHVPVVVSAHPKKRGKYISARNRNVINKQKVGVLLHNKYVGEFQEGEAWIDKARIDKLEPRFKNYVKRGLTVEVSTGVLAHAKRKRGIFHGKWYDQVATNLEPDHLALLMDEVGACSVANGCGLFTASKGVSPKRMKRVQDAITNAWNGKSNCSCHQRKEKSMKTKKKVKKLSRREKVATLINARVGWKKKDKEWLSEQDAEVIDRLMVQATKLKPVNTKIKSPSMPETKNRRRREEDERTDSTIPNKNRKKKAKGKKAKGKKGRLANAASPKKMLARILASMSPKQIVQAMPGGLGDMFANGLKAHGNNRRRLIDVIVSAENSEFDKKELLDEVKYPLKTLRKLSKLAVHESNDGDDPYAPFMGVAGAPIANSSRRGKESKQSSLPLPSMPLRVRKGGKKR